MSNLLVRLATAVVMIPVLLGLIYFGPAWGWLAFICLAAGVGAYEMFGMTHPEDQVARGVGIVLTLLVTLGLWFGLDSARLLITVLVAIPVLSLLLTLWRLGEMPSVALRVAGGAFGPLWVGLGLGAVALLRVVGKDDGGGYVVLSLGLAWIGDTGGYFAGRAFGKHKLYEEVSPKKTVEGAIGGVVATVIFAVVMSLFFLSTLPIRDAVILGVLGSVLGICGDLGESLLKRSSGVKDSGGIVPGHGGILDRIDALLITGPLTLLYLLWTKGG